MTDGKSSSRKTLVGSLLLGAVGVVVPATAGAQGSDAEAAPPPPAYETTITALRFPRPLRDVPNSVTVIPRDEIDRTPAQASDDLLRLVPGAGTFRRTPALTADPTSQGLNLRGIGPSGVSRALVLLDGVPMNDPFGGWVYWRAFPRLGLDRIEVAPGGTSALYGNYALGGVVHLISRPIDNEIDADLAYGSWNTGTIAARAAGRHGVVGGAVEVEGLQSDGYVPVSRFQRGPIDREADSRHGAANARVEVQPTQALRIGARATVFDEEQNGGTQFTTADVRTMTGALNAQYELPRGGALAGTFFATRERFEQQRARIAAGRTSEVLSVAQKVPSHSFGSSLVWSSPVWRLAGNHQLLVGVDHRQVTGTSNETLFPAMPSAMAVVERRAGGDQRFIGGFAQAVYAPHPVVELAASYRLDHWANLEGQRLLRRMSGAEDLSAFEDRSGVEQSGRFGLLLRPVDLLRVRASVYRAFRAPTLNELYRPFQVGTITTAANETLKPEHLLGGELGGEVLIGRATVVRATGFWNELQDPIINVTLPMPVAVAQRQRQNLGRARIRGFDASVDARLTGWLAVNAAYTLADNRVTSAPGYTEIVGKRLPQDPVHRARAGLLLSRPRWGEFNAQVRVQGKQYEDDQNMLPMKAFEVYDLFAAVPVRWGVSVYGTVQNLLDRRYLVGRAGIDTVGPGRLMLIGLRLR